MRHARSEGTRSTYDPGHLYYTLGKLQIRKLRNDWRAQEGAGSFSPQRFHDAFLSHGMPPIRLLREQMLREAKVWGDFVAQATSKCGNQEIRNCDCLKTATDVGGGAE